MVLFEHRCPDIRYILIHELILHDCASQEAESDSTNQNNRERNREVSSELRPRILAPRSFRRIWSNRFECVD